MEKHIVGENGISYTLGADGLFYPDLKLSEGTDYEIGKYGRIRFEYLKSYHKLVYMELLCISCEYCGNWSRECGETKPT